MKKERLKDGETYSIEAGEYTYIINAEKVLRYKTDTPPWPSATRSFWIESEEERESIEKRKKRHEKITRLIENFRIT